MAALQPVTLDQDQEARDMVERANILAAKVDRYLEIKDEEEAARAQELLAQIKRSIRAIDEKRKTLGAPFREGLNNLNAEFKPYLDMLNKELSRLNPSVTRYLVEKEREADRQRREAERKAQEEAEKQRERIEAQYRKEMEKLEAEREQVKDERKRRLIEDEINGLRRQLGLSLKRFEEEEKKPAATPTRVHGVHGSSSTLRKDYAYELVDITKVPEKYLKPPEERLDYGKLREAARGKRKIAGLKLVEKHTTMTR